MMLTFCKSTTNNITPNTCDTVNEICEALYPHIWYSRCFNCTSTNKHNEQHYCDICAYHDTSIGTCPTCRTISTLNILMPGRGPSIKHQHCSCSYVWYMVMSHCMRFPYAIVPKLMMQNSKVYCLQECSSIIQCIFPTSNFNVLQKPLVPALHTGQL